MSSTTDRMRGQSLAIFSISLTALILAAALALDGGMMMLERRDQQNAADAAAIAAARYVLNDTSTAQSVAISVATANGFTHGVNSQSVSVSIPPTSGPNAGNPDFVEVQISSSRPSLFGGIMGVANWPVSARSVATDQEGSGGSFSFLSLDPAGCDAMLVSGNGDVTAYGNIQVNSTCDNGALRRQGGGDITVDVDSGACNVVGDIKDGGGQGVIDCVQNEGAPLVPDPLILLPPPSLPPLPQAAVQVVGSMSTPSGCPGSASPATLASPATCQFQSSYAGTTWRLYPGLYPGGIKLQGGNFYLEPGVYYIGGGGLDFTGNGTETISVEPNGTTGPDGGVMFYNTELPGSAAGPVYLNGASAAINLLPLDDGSRYAGLLIYQDRTIDIGGDDVTINGSDSGMVLRGTIYVPAGDVKVNGSGGALTIDQVVADRFTINGAPGGHILALKEVDFVVKVRAAGLVE